MKFSDKVYNILKWIAISAIPILIIATSRVLNILDVPGETINKIIEIIDTMGVTLAALIGISTITYNKTETTAVYKGLDIVECHLTQNDIYKQNRTIVPKGIVVHSTGCNQTWLGRFVQPSEDNPNRDELITLLGKNYNENSWNRPGVDKLVHFMLGYDDKETSIHVIETAPCTMRIGGVAGGVNGSYNDTHIQFEMLEDSLDNEEYFNAMTKTAIRLCAELCVKYNISVSDICSHKECAERGYGSYHGDPENWLTRYGKDMDWFRSEVNKFIANNILK